MLAGASKRIRRQLTSDLFDKPLIQNNLRGVWMEYVVADALGPNFKYVGHDWHAWDIQFGSSQATYPKRIRIQVKNTARTQTWGKRLKILSNCRWNISLHNQPSYFEKYNPRVPCERYGFLCDLFVLCHHPEEDWCKADHRNLAQWNFYVLPVTRDHTIYPIHEIDQNKRQKAKSFIVTPENLVERAKPRMKPIKIGDLNESSLFDCLKGWRRYA
jgi:hypothetical protein